MNVLEKFRQRQESKKNRQQARQLRSQFSPELRVYIDRIIADVWTESGDVAESTRITEIKVRHDSQAMEIDPQTILLLIQFALAIYSALKQLHIISATDELVTALSEGNDD